MLTGDQSKGQTCCPPGRRREQRSEEGRQAPWVGWQESERASERLGQPLPEAAATLRTGSAPGHVLWGRARLPRTSRPLPRAPHSQNPRGLSFLLAGSAAALRARPHAHVSRRSQPAGRAATLQPRSHHDPEPHPMHRKSPTGKEPLARDEVRKPGSRELGEKPSRGAGPTESVCMCAIANPPTPPPHPG